MLKQVAQHRHRSHEIATDQIRHDGRHAPVRHMSQLNAGFFGKYQALKMHDGTGRWRAIERLVGLGPFHKLLQRTNLGRYTRPDHKRLGVGAHRRDGSQILERVIRQTLVHMGKNHDRRRWRQHGHRAIGLRIFDRFIGNPPTCTDAGLHDHRLGIAAAQTVCQAPGNHIQRATGGKAHFNPHGAWLGPRWQHGQSQRSCRALQNLSTRYAHSPSLDLLKIASALNMQQHL